MKDPIIERIAPELMPLIPTFLDNCRIEAEQVEQALATEDWDTVSRLGHAIKGAGGWYGFSGLSRLGFCIQVSGNEHSSGTRRFVQELFEYLDRVRVIPLDQSAP